MDRVTIMLQNKQLIEELINSSEETKAKIHAAIIDGVSKRIVKNVVNNTDASIRAAIENAQVELQKKYTEEKKQGWSSYYNLKKEYTEVVKQEVERAWRQHIDASVKEVAEKVTEVYKLRLESAFNCYIAKINRMTDNLDEEIKKAVNENISKRLNG